MNEPSSMRGRAGERRRGWLLVLALTIAAALLGLAYDTLQNSGGDISDIWLSRKVERYIEAHPDLSASDVADLRARRVVKGWDREKCRVAWGSPENIVTITSMGTEIWQYGGNRRPATLVFTNGVLTDFGP
jgi:hypothetical protein